MRERIVEAFKQHLARNNLEASSQENYDMLTPKCNQQKGQNCTLHVCYNMKRLLKGNLGSPEEGITPKMDKMRGKLTFKIIDDVDLRREG
ncbi:hypothetical protein MKW94_000197 [Papaver nudicaule]|uniref:Uncharacterized protein n=1 Tax=Papaver nudicaule TaxID=74823 RepID=A0AA42AWX6_PAPNU|nr:hypothetical protein [Papaver nudicaule]